MGKGSHLTHGFEAVTFMDIRNTFRGIGHPKARNRHVIFGMIVPLDILDATCRKAIKSGQIIIFHQPGFP